MSNSYCSSEPFSYAATEQDCTLGLVIQIFNGSYDAGVDLYVLIVAHKAVTKWIKSYLLQCFGTFKMPILMFISILVFRPEGLIWNPVRRDTRIYVRRILNASRISKTQLNSCTISPS